MSTIFKNLAATLAAAALALTFGAAVAGTADAEDSASITAGGRYNPTPPLMS